MASRRPATRHPVPWLLALGSSGLFAYKAYTATETSCSHASPGLDVCLSHPMYPDRLEVGVAAFVVFLVVWSLSTLAIGLWRKFMEP
jgi:hypothetical protein